MGVDPSLVVEPVEAVRGEDDRGSATASNRIGHTQVGVDVERIALDVGEERSGHEAATTAGGGEVEDGVLGRVVEQLHVAVSMFTAGVRPASTVRATWASTATQSTSPPASWGRRMADMSVISRRDRMRATTSSSVTSPRHCIDEAGCHDATGQASRRPRPLGRG